MFLSSAFSLNMLESMDADVSVRPLEVEDVRDFERVEGLISVVGHPDTARVFTGILGFDVPCNRQSLTIDEGRFVVGQYRGPRLEAGATELPQGAIIEWALVVIKRGRG